jgi:AmmeMemoRadiSam system protein A
MTDIHPLVQLARKTIENYIREGHIIEAPKELTSEMKGQAGTFVSIHKHGMLRGCIGTIEPTKPNVAQEVIQNAISSATRDPRFPPIGPEELADLDIKVDVLGEPEPVDGLEELDPKRYGVIVPRARDWRKGLLLPDLEGVDTVEYQVDIARRKAGIRPGEPVELYRFEVVRYT